MLDTQVYRPTAGAIKVLSRLARDYGREHKWSYVGAGLLLGLTAGCTTLVALLLRPILNGMATAARFPEMRFLAFFVLGLFVFRGLATFGAQVLLARVGNRIIATV